MSGAAHDDGLTARVRGVGLWIPTFANVEAWRTQSADPEMTAPKVKFLDRQTSRRASPFGKAVVASFAEAARQAEIELSDVGTVFGSALGEVTVMLKLLDQMQTTPEDFSPMMFAVSVHNAASGLVSISSKNRAFTTSIAADFDTPAAALMEAIGVSRDRGVPAVLVCGDEASPGGFVPEDEMFETVAVAMVVDATEAGREAPSLAEIGAFSMAEATIPGADAAPRLRRNPQAGLLDLVDSIAHQRFGRLRLDRGQGQGWTVDVRAAGA